MESIQRGSTKVSSESTGRIVRTEDSIPLTKEKEVESLAHKPGTTPEHHPDAMVSAVNAHPPLLAAPDSVAANPDSSPENGPDPYNLDELFVPPKLVLTFDKPAPLSYTRKPPKDQFFRVLPFDFPSTGVSGYTNCLPVSIFRFRHDGEMDESSYYIRPNSDAYKRLSLDGRIASGLLVLCQTRGGTQFVWEISLPDGRNKMADKWSNSRLLVAREACTKWLKPTANKGSSGYDITVAESISEPDWSGASINEVVKNLPDDKVISSNDHPAMREYLGR